MSRDAAWAVSAGDDPKWRRKPLESLKTDSGQWQSAGPRSPESIRRISDCLPSVWPELGALAQRRPF